MQKKKKKKVKWKMSSTEIKSNEMKIFHKKYSREQ